MNMLLRKAWDESDIVCSAREIPSLSNTSPPLHLILTHAMKLELLYSTWLKQPSHVSQQI